MVSSCYRANVLTRCIIAVLTKHGLVSDIWIIHITAIVPIYTKPVHIMKALYFVFTNYRNVVLGNTGYYASTATNTTIHVNIHPPLNTRFLVVRIECTCPFKFLQTSKRLKLLFTLFKDFIRMCLKLCKTHLFYYLSTYALSSSIGAVCLYN